MVTHAQKQDMTPIFSFYLCESSFLYRVTRDTNPIVADF